MYSGKEINLGPLNEDEVFKKNLNNFSPKSAGKLNNNKFYQKVPNSSVIKMDPSDPKDSLVRVNPPTKKQISMFVALTVLTIYTQGIELGGNSANPLLGEDGDLRVMTHEEVCGSQWILGKVCVRPFMIFWMFKQVLLVFYFIICFLFFKKYF